MHPPISTLTFSAVMPPRASDLLVHDIFAAQAERTPDATAVLCDGVALSYHELNARANRLAHYLQGLGVGPEVIVGVCLDRSSDMLVAVWGVLKAGGAYLPLDPANPEERLAFMVRDARPAVVLTHTSYRDRFAETVRAVCLDAIEELLTRAGAPPAHDATPTTLAYVIYTSGSTGTPKGVLIEHRGVRNLALAQQRELDVCPADRVLQFFSLAFDASVWDILIAHLTGATLCLVTGEALRPGPALLRFLRDNAITVATLTPSLLAALPDADLPALRLLSAAGEVCPPAVVRRWAPGRRFFDAYGPTEATVCATLAPWPADDWHTHPGGEPLPHASIHVLDEQGNPVPPDQQGEIYIGGSGVARGYLHRPELTAAAFLPHPLTHDPTDRVYRTGDGGTLLPNGRLIVHGRRDDGQVKLRGYRIELGEIEAVLRRHAGVRESAVAVRDERLVAYVVPMDDQPPALTEVRAFLETYLPAYMIPHAFVVLDALPLTTNGKTDRSALPIAQWAALVDDTFVAPRTAVERRLVEIVAGIVQVESSSVNLLGNFLLLGGSSLSVVRLMLQAQDAFGVELDVMDIYDCSLERLAASIAAIAATTAREP